MSYGWPGNVREMKNVMERAAMLAETDTIGPEDLGLPIDSVVLKAVADSIPPDGMRLEEAERHHIVRVLESVGGSRTRAASVLGISRSTLWEKGKRYGLF